MSLFGRILGHGQNDADTSKIAKTNNTIVDPNGIEHAIEEKANSIRLEDCLRIPLSSMAALGIGFSQMVPSLRTVTQTLKTGEMAYVPINNLAGELLKQYSKSQPNVYAGTFNRNGKSVMAMFRRIPASQTVTTTIPINPAVIVMAAVLVSIDKKLDKIQETQNNILSFLEQDKQAEMQADLNILTDCLSAYRHNWDNDQFKSNHHMKILDIKQASEKNAIFYQSQIATAIRKLPAFHNEQTVSSGIKSITALFQNYRMALYLYGFSSFLEAMLLGNFKEDYLRQVADKVQQYNEHYNDQLAKCREMLKSYSSGSVEKQIIGGIGNVSKTLGKLIASSPILSKGPVDEWLQDGGNKLLSNNAAGAEKATSSLENEAAIGNEMFIDSIRSIETICNHTTGMLFDNNEVLFSIA